MIRSVHRPQSALPRAIAISVVIALSLVSLWNNSRSIDGVRYFWLDDDQMISMRYARNLIEGHGLVYNPGERVEGYTNFLWTLVMALVHLLPVTDATASLVVRLLNCGLTILVLWQSERLLLEFRPRARMATPLLLALLVLSHDLLFWSVHGFETTLITLLFVSVVLRIFQEADAGAPRVATFVSMGFLPLIRSDGFHLLAALALLALGLAKDKRRTGWLSLLACALPLAHLAFRRSYYGNWGPNTYYLKVVGIALETRLTSGALYYLDVLARYCVALPLAILGAVRGRDRRRGLLLAGFALSSGYAIWVGGDVFMGSRFVAHFVPVLFVLACSAVDSFTIRGRAAPAVAGALLAVSIAVDFCARVLGPFPSVFQDENGAPAASLVASLLVLRHSRADARIAVHAAGIVPYFSHRYAVDWLGKTDPHVARLPPHDDHIGHNRYDPEYSLGCGVDLVALAWLPPGLSRCTPRDRQSIGGAAPPWVRAMYLSPTFQREFCNHAIELNDAVPIYVRASAPEARSLEHWAPPAVSR